MARPLQRTLSVLVLARCLPSSASDSPPAWSAGSYTHFRLGVDGSYTLGFGGGSSSPRLSPYELRGTLNTSLLSSWVATESINPGSALGPSSELSAQTLLAGGGGALPGNLTIRYWRRFDIFEFETTQWQRQRQRQSNKRTPDYSLAFPAFHVLDEPTLNASLGWLGYGREMFFPGHGTVGTTGIDVRAKSDGPLFLVDPVGRSTLFASASDTRFDSHHTPAVDTASGLLGVPGCDVSSSSGSGMPVTCSSVWGARPGLVRASRCWGAFMRQKHHAVRTRGSAVSKLSYWDDNRAGYSWWSVGRNMTVWGTPQEIFRRLKAGYDRHEVPLGAWEVDCNFAAGYDRPDGLGWCFKDAKRFNATLFPGGGNLSVMLGGLPMTFYIDYFCSDTVHRKELGGKYSFVDVSGFSPRDKGLAMVAANESLAFYTDVLSFAKEHFQMEMLFFDFLGVRQGKNCQSAASRAECGKQWLAGVAEAALAQQMEVQFCMAYPNQLIQSLDWPAVTNARASGDGGNCDAYTFASLLAAVLGIGWSTDNIKIAGTGGCTDPPCFGGGSSPEHARLSAILAVQSLGPAGLADQLSAPVSDPAADITSNVSLAKSMVAADGTLLQPSFPLTPIEPMLLQQEGLGFSKSLALTKGNGSAWATYTAVNFTGSAPLVFWSVLFWKYVDKHHKTPPFNFVLQPSHLAPMVDEAALPARRLDDVPNGAFLGAGADELPHPQRVPILLAARKPAHIVWTPAHVSNTFTSCSVGGSVAAFATDAPHTLVSDGWPTQSFISPVVWLGSSIGNSSTGVGGLAFLGELSKLTAVSFFRFPSIEQAPRGLTVSVQGRLGEVVRLAFVQVTPQGQLACHTKDAKVGSSGRTIVALTIK